MPLTLHTFGSKHSKIPAATALIETALKRKEKLLVNFYHSTVESVLSYSIRV